MVRVDPVIVDLNGHATLSLAEVKHASDHDLERLYMGTIVDEAELALIEEHLMLCGACIERGEATIRYVEAMRKASASLRDEEKNSGSPKTAAALSS